MRSARGDPRLPKTVAERIRRGLSLATIPKRAVHVVHTPPAGGVKNARTQGIRWFDLLTFFVIFAISGRHASPDRLAISEPRAALEAHISRHTMRRFTAFSRRNIFAKSVVVGRRRTFAIPIFTAKRIILAGIGLVLAYSSSPFGTRLDTGFIGSAPAVIFASPRHTAAADILPAALDETFLAGRTVPWSLALSLGHRRAKPEILIDIFMGQVLAIFPVLTRVRKLTGVRVRGTHLTDPETLVRRTPDAFPSAWTIRIGTALAGRRRSATAVIIGSADLHTNRPGPAAIRIGAAARRIRNASPVLIGIAEFLTELTIRATVRALDIVAAGSFRIDRALLSNANHAFAAVGVLLTLDIHAPRVIAKLVRSAFAVGAATVITPSVIAGPRRVRGAIRRVGSIPEVGFLTRFAATPIVRALRPRPTANAVDLAIASMRG